MKCNIMRAICVIIYCIFLLTTSDVSSQQEINATFSFEKRVDIFEKFFSSRPKFLEKQAFKNSPTGYIFFWVRYDNCKVSYDVRKTDSLVSPYVGYITVTYIDELSKNCGDVRVPGDVRESEASSFSTIDTARKNRDNESCYKKSISRGIKFIFAFQKGNWIFKEALNTYSNDLDPRFATVIGKSIGTRIPVEDNDFWKILIE
jgi:hypothetical protein